MYFNSGIPSTTYTSCRTYHLFNHHLLFEFVEHSSPDLPHCILTICKIMDLISSPNSAKIQRSALIQHYGSANGCCYCWAQWHESRKKLYCQSLLRQVDSFPAWTSRVQIPSPALKRDVALFRSALRHNCRVLSCTGHSQ